MTIYRKQHNKQNPYVILDKRFLEDPSLSAKAKGILAYLLSRPDGWVAQAEQIASVMTDGLGSIKSGLQELEGAGYFRRSPVRDPNTGRITQWVKDVFEEPQNLLSPQVGFPLEANPVSGKPSDGNPLSGKPSDGNPSLLINKDEVTTDLEINEEEVSPLTPQGETTAEQSSFPDQQDPDERTQLADNPEPPPPTPSPGACDNKTLNTKQAKNTLNQQEADRFLDAYRAEKPSNFTNHQKLSDTHVKGIKKLLGSYGSDRALEVFKAALIYCREQQDTWWRNGLFSLNNLASNGKLEDYADRHFDAMERDSQYQARVEGRSLSMDVARHYLFTTAPTSTTPTPSKDSVRPVEPSNSVKMPQSFYKAEAEALRAKLTERANEQKKPERPKQSIAEVEAELKALLGK